MNFKASLKAARGVTLVELIVVVAIIAIVAAVASPSIFNSLRRERASGVAREVANELRRARNQAMARGEIIIVTLDTSAGRGTVTTFATTKDPYTKGAVACDLDADPAIGCATGEVCLNKECWAEPARSCREWDTDDEFLREVASYDLNISDGPNMALRGTSAGNEVTLCFSPDGRVLTTDGIPFVGGATTCEGENFVTWVGDADATLGTAVTDCDGTSDVRDAVNYYRIAIPYNGAISVNQ